MKLRVLLILTLLLLVLTLVSGSVRPVGRELSGMEFVRVMGVDNGEDGGIRLTASVSAAEEQTQSTTMLTADAETLTRAVDKLQVDTDQYTFFGFVEHYILGEEAAKGGVRRLLDYMERDLYMRLDTVVYVARDKDAGQVIQAMAGEGDSIAKRLDILREDVGLLLLPRPVTLREFIASLDRNGSGLVPVLELSESKEKEEKSQAGGESQIGQPEQSSGSNESQEETSQIICFAGYAIFAKERLQGYIEASDVLGANLLLQQPLQATVEIAGASGEPVALSVVSNTCRIHPETESGKLTGLRVECALTAELAEVQGEENVLENLSYYEEEASRKIRQKMQNVLERSQALNADFLDLQEAVEREEPRLWLEEVKDRWSEIFPDLALELEVSVKVSRSYESLVRAGGAET